MRRKRQSLDVRHIRDIDPTARTVKEPLTAEAVCEGCAGGPTGNPSDWTKATIRVTWPDYPGCEELLCEVCARKYA